MPFGDRGAQMRNNSMVRTVCPLRMRVQRRSHHRTSGMCGQEGNSHMPLFCLACPIFPSAHCQPGLW